MTVVETVIETVEIDDSSPYSFELLREMAKTGDYIGDPASGHSLAFANIDRSLPYCVLIEESIRQEWELAGGSGGSLFVLDNMSDPDMAIINAKAIFEKRPGAFLQFQADALTNASIGKKADEEGIPIMLSSLRSYNCNRGPCSRGSLYGNK